MSDTVSLLADAVAALDDGFAVLDADGTVLAANPAYRDRFAGVAPPAAPADEEREVTPGRWLRLRTWPAGPGRMAALVRDVTRERHLRAHLVEAIEALGEPFSIFDADERLVINNAARRTFMGGNPETQTPGITIEELMRASTRASGRFATEAEVEDYVRRRVAGFRGEAPMIEALSGPEKWTRTEVRRLKSGGRVIVIGDITELKQREHELEAARDAAEEANRAKSAFLATVSHEIRTPMNGVLGMMEVLERQGLSEEQRQSLTLMRDSATSLLRIIDDILDFSKIEAGKLDLEAIPFAPRDLVGGVVDTLSVRAEAKRLVLVSHVAEQVPERLVGDPTRLRQILFNLIGNALKFTDRGFVRVTVDGVPADGEVELSLSIEDSGIGMSGEEIARLFRPFAQADSSTTRRFGGSGLGLSIVKRLAESMDGDVTVSSVPGRGSTFVVRIRLAPAPVGAEEPAGPAELPSIAAAGKVLVVDDHPVNREVLSRQLALLGVAADTAEDGAQALARWQTGRYAALLVDLHMPVMDGYELARRVRTAETSGSRARTPIVAVTANALMGESERCLAAGMDAFLTKPTTLERLNTTLARWMAVGATETPGAGGQAPAFDRGALHALFGDDTQTVSRLLVTFRESAQASAAEIDAALSRGDLETVAGAAHRIKGAARTIGAAALGDAAQALEQAGRGADAERAQMFAGKLASELRRVELEL